MKKVYIYLSVILAAIFPARLFAQSSVDTLASVERTYTKEFLDTVDLKRKVLINDYSTVGVQWGVSLSGAYFTPSKSGQEMVMSPKNIGLTYTRYGKMFGYMPYFGFQTGFFYGQNGFSFKEPKEPNEDGTPKTRSNVDGAYETTYEYLEVPILAVFHVDTGAFRVEANVGPYGGYRKSVSRKGDETMDAEYAEKFHDYDRRADYGIRGGIGFGLIFDPMEFYLGAQIRYAFSSLYKPDYYSQYYYRYAYPYDIIISAGVRFQLSRRLGKTKAQLRNEAKELVIGGNK